MIIVLKEVILKYTSLRLLSSRFCVKLLDKEKYKYLSHNYSSSITTFGKKDQLGQQGDHLTQSAAAGSIPSKPLPFPPPMLPVQSSLVLLHTQPTPAPFPSLLSYSSNQCPWLVSCPQIPHNPQLPPYTPPGLPPLPSTLAPSDPPLSSPKSPLPQLPPPPSYPPPAQPPPPQSSPPTTPPSPSALPQPTLQMLKSSDESSPLPDLGFACLPGNGSLPLPVLPMTLPEINNLAASNNSTELGSASDAFFVDKMPSKVYIEVEKPRRLRQTVLHNRYVSSAPQHRGKVFTPTRNLVPCQTFGPMRSHYKNKRSTPELITLSDDECDDICVLEEEKDSLPTNESISSNKAVPQSSISNLLSPIPVDDISLPEPSLNLATSPSSFVSCHIPETDSPFPSPYGPQASNQRSELSSSGERTVCDTPTKIMSAKKSNVIASCSKTVLNSAKMSQCMINGVLIDCKTGKEIVEIGSDDDGNDDNVEGEKNHDHIDSTNAMEVEVASLSCGNTRVQEPAEVPHDVIKGLDEVDKEYVPLASIRLSDIINQNIYISDDAFEQRQSLQQLREWESTGFALHNTNKDRRDAIFTLMSYNVLAQQLLLDNQYLYSNCNADHLEWPYRWTLLQYEITEMNPDILTLQEVQSNHYHEFYLPWLTHLGYQGVFKKRTGVKKADGCAIFFRKGKFTLLESISVEYCQPQTFLDRDNVGLVCSLQSIENGTKFCVATTHLLFNPRRHEIRLAQVQMLLAEVERLSFIGANRHTGQPEYSPVIVTGDMNAVPQSTLIHFLKNGFLDYNGRMTNRLLPPILRMTNTCQHEGVLQLRSQLQERVQTPGARPVTREEQRYLEEARLGLFHSERKNQQQTQYFDQSNSSQLQHPFSLRSVFKHTLTRLGGAPEITTMASQHQTVDYILYSLVFSRQHGRPVEGPLKLLARYGLLSAPEVKQFGPAPSAVLPSDHLPLAAKFMLKKSR